MSEIFPQQKLFPYDGSQNLSKNPLLISPTDITDSDNIVYTNYSTKKLRPGITDAFTKLIPGNERVLGGFDFWRLGQRRIVWYDGKRLKATKGDGTVDDITGGHNLPIDQTISFAVMAGLLIIFFGGGQTPIKIWTMTGDIADLSPDAPNAPFGRVWYNSLFIPDPILPGRILKSNTGDPTDFLTGDAQAIDCDVNDADQRGVTAVFPPLFDSLYVTKRRGTWRIQPQLFSNGETQSIAWPAIKISEVGCISHNAAQAIEDSVMFPSDRGFHYVETSNRISGVQTSFLSNNIQREYLKGTNFRRSQYMQSVYDFDLNSYLVIFPKIGNNFCSDLWGYSLIAKKWYRWRNYNQSAIFSYVDTQVEKVRTMVCSSTGRFGYIDDESNTDYGKRYSLYLQSAIIAPSGTPDDNFVFKAIAPIFVPQLSGSFDITYKVNGKKIETMTFPMTAEGEEQKLGEDFETGIDVLGSLPQIKLDKRTAAGNGLFYDLLVRYSPGDNAPKDESFELLGILVDVDPINKVTGGVSA